MSTSSDLNCDRLRKQRNAFTIGAICAIALIFVGALPRHIHDYRAQKAANDELIALQNQINDLLDQTRAVQKQILETQAAIRAKSK